MIRARFRANIEDPRPMTWPIKHPYWITGEGDDYATVVAYADDMGYILENWPDAKQIDARNVTGYEFSDRFPKPDWLTVEA